jgi:hypothetical protein
MLSSIRSKSLSENLNRSGRKMIGDERRFFEVTRKIIEQGSRSRFEKSRWKELASFFWALKS